VALEQYANAPQLSSPSSAWTTTSGSVTSGDTSLTVASASAFPSSAQFRILIDDELLLVTAGAGTTTWTVTRGIESTTAAAHSSGASVYHVLTAASLLRSPGALSATGDVPYLASTGAPTRLAAGADGTYLRYASGIPTAAALLATDLTAIPGSTTQVFFNDGATWGADAGFTFVKGASATLRVANGTNPEVGAIGWSGNNFRVGTIGGTTGGTARDTILGSAAGAANGIYFATEDTSRWNVNPTGHLVPFATATYDLGDASHVLRNVYAVLTNATGLPISTGLSGLGSNVATFLGTPSSANLAAALTDETGSGAAMFGTSPTVTTSLIMADAANLVLNTGTGTKIGTATGQKLSFWNQTPTAQPSGAGQAAITDSTGGVAASSLVDVTTAAVADPAKVNANFATINVLLLALRTAALNTGLIKGSA